MFGAQLFPHLGEELNETVYLMAAVAAAGACLVAFAALVWAFANSDFSVLNVALNSRTDKPFLYKVAAAWGSHEGSMLLWVTILGIAGGAVATAAGFGVIWH